jgi:hypothetical protein
MQTEKQKLKYNTIIMKTKMFLLKKNVFYFLVQSSLFQLMDFVQII